MQSVVQRELLSTGEAASLCSVTPDTVLRWIKKGRLQAARTAGGHYRVARSDIEPFMILPARIGADRPVQVSRAASGVPCWEYLGERGEVREACRQCVVYRVRATRCFLMAGTVGHSGIFCTGSCEQCSYFRRVQHLTARVLFITSDGELVERLECAEHEDVCVRFATNAYQAAVVVEAFRPAFAIIDAECFSAWESELLEPLARDPRLPGLKVILIVSPRMTVWRRRQLRTGPVVSVLDKPFGCRSLIEAIRGNLEPGHEDSLAG
jgi:excisionase family DNA binding protein